jgi:hypothetical protein
MRWEENNVQQTEMNGRGSGHGHFQGLCLKWLRGTMKYLSQDNWYPEPRYEVGTYGIHIRCVCAKYTCPEQK